MTGDRECAKNVCLGQSVDKHCIDSTSVVGKGKSHRRSIMALLFSITDHLPGTAYHWPAATPRFKLNHDRYRSCDIDREKTVPGTEFTKADIRHSVYLLYCKGRSFPISSSGPRAKAMPAMISVSLDMTRMGRQARSDRAIATSTMTFS